MTPQRLPFTPSIIVIAFLALFVGGCESDEVRSLAATGGSSEGEAPSTAEQLRQDSLARWEAKFADRVPKPDSIRGLYVNGWAAGSRSRMAALLRIAEETEINTFVIDIKESDTFLTYDSTAIPLALEIGADQRPASHWLPELVDTLQARGIYPIARIVVFKFGC